MKTKIVALLVITMGLYSAGVSQATETIFYEAERQVKHTGGAGITAPGLASDRDPLLPGPMLLVSDKPLTNPGDFPDDQPPGTDHDTQIDHRGPEDDQGHDFPDEAHENVRTLASRGFYIWTDDDQPGGNSNANPPSQEFDEGNGRATYPVKLEGGDYRIWMRVNTAFSDSWWIRLSEKGANLTPTSGDGGVLPSPVSHNYRTGIDNGDQDYWVRFDISGNGGGGPNGANPARPPIQTEDGDNGQGGWFWDEVKDDQSSDQVVTWTLAAGEYEIWVEHREDGVGLDAIMITNDLSLVSGGPGGLFPLGRTEIIPSRFVENPDPAFGEDFVPIETDLDWDVPDDPNEDEFVYTVYFGTDPNFGPPNPAVITEGDPAGSPKFPIAGDLDYSTNYFWQVDTIDPNFGAPIVLASAIHTFKTLPGFPVFQSVSPDELLDDGDSASFTVVATAPAVFDPITFQWFSGDPADGPGVALVNGGDISGVTTDTLGIANVEKADQGPYHCKAQNNDPTSTVVSSPVQRLFIRQLIVYYNFNNNINDSSDNGLDSDFVGDDDDPNVVHVGLTGEGPGPGGAFGFPRPAFADGANLGIQGNAFWGDGTGSFAKTLDGAISDAMANQINGLAELTMSIWVNSNNQNTDDGFYHTHPPHNSDDGGMRYDAVGAASGRSNLQKISIGILDGEISVETSEDSQVSNEWQHVALTWRRGEQIIMYINGAQDELADTAAAGSNTRIAKATGLFLGIGAKNEPGQNDSWDGMIDEVRIWNFVLTRVGLASLTNQQTGDPVCIFSEIERDTTGPESIPDCIQDIFDFNDWAADFLDCQLIGTCIPVVPVP